ncbi:hypothetical protein HY213_03700 [Candidatus Peregrinibacteria bacterium]|nr:hypothetical protein [Candidatus Peregrinibacteria bacterium]
MAVGTAPFAQAFARIYDSPGGLLEGLKIARQIHGISALSLREIILQVLLGILDLVGLAAVFAITITGVLLVVGGGSDPWRMKAKHMMLWTVIGLIVILTARLIVSVILALFT